MGWIDKRPLPHRPLPHRCELPGDSVGLGSVWECDDCGRRFVRLTFGAIGWWARVPEPPPPPRPDSTLTTYD